jgi:SAM-dependent methyltransferase
MAPGWERRRAQLAEALTPVREWLIGELRPQPGETVLELGAGVGDTGFKAAAILGERGRLVSTDCSQEMVEVARRRGTELGLGNVDNRVIDAERIELDSGSVDGVLCQSTYMLIADPAAALAETRRMLRPVGRLALSVWGAPERNPVGLDRRHDPDRARDTCPHRSQGRPGSSAWRAQSGPGRCSTARASGRSALRR